MDELLNTILIEVNTNPCLEESNKLLKKVLPRMIDDLLNIVSDPIFNNAYGSGSSPPSTPKDFGYFSKYKLPGSIFSERHKGYKDNENLFEHICNLND